MTKNEGKEIPQVEREAMLALDRHDCWHEAVGQFSSETGPNDVLGEYLLDEALPQLGIEWGRDKDRMCD